MVFQFSFAQKIVINGNQFQVNGKPIFLNGLNTPWQNDRNFKIDYLDTNHFDLQYWKNEFQNMKNNNVNFVRIWVHGRGNNTPQYDNNGFVLSPSTRFYNHLDAILNEATTNNVYVLITMWSFDMVLKSGNGQPGSSQFQKHRNVIKDTNKLTSYVDNFLGDVVNKYKDNPIVLGYDIINEPEHMWENANDLVDGQINRNEVIRFVARCAAKIHEASTNKSLVTVGSKWTIFNSSKFTSWGTHTGDNYTDTELQTQYNNTHAFLDFYSMHWYQWQSSGAPFTETTNTLYPGVTKPIVITEYPGLDLPNNDCGCTCTDATVCNFNATIIDAYEKIYQNGFAGIAAWRNGTEDDNFGKSVTIYEATKAFGQKHPTLVFPNKTLSIKNDYAPTRNINFKLYPTPSIDNKVTLDIVINEQDSITIDIFNAIGQLIHTQKTANLSSGKHTFPINLSEVKKTKGLLFVKASTTTQYKIFKVF